MGAKDRIFARDLFFAPPPEGGELLQTLKKELPGALRAPAPRRSEEAKPEGLFLVRVC